MKIGVISDTHGDQGSIRQAVKSVPNVDMWLHAGDYSQDIEYMSSLALVPIFAAKGNCDGHATAKIDEFLEVAGKKIWLTHGHRYNVKQGPEDLVWWGRHYAVDIVIYGHTHIPDNRWFEEMLIFNPGSAACPSFGHATCGILDFNNEGRITASIIDLAK